MLHTVNKSPFERNTLEACLKRAVPGSAVLLIEDAVYAALANTTLSGAMESAASRFEVSSALRVAAPSPSTRAVRALTMRAQTSFTASGNGENLMPR